MCSGCYNEERAYEIEYVSKSILERKEIRAKISKDMIISDLIQVDPNIVAILMRAGMHCIGCPSAQGESLEEACMVHGIDADLLTEQINDYLAQ